MSDKQGTKFRRLRRMDFNRKKVARRTAKYSNGLSVKEMWDNRFDAAFPIKLACFEGNTTVEVGQKLFTSLCRWLLEKDALFLFYLAHCKCAFCYKYFLLFFVFSFLADCSHGHKNECFDVKCRDEILQSMERNCCIGKCVGLILVLCISTNIFFV